MLGPDYRPLHASGPSESLPPRWPLRLQHFMYACAKAAAIIDGKMKDTRGLFAPPRPRERGEAPRGPDGRKGVFLPDGSFVPMER